MFAATDCKKTEARRLRLLSVYCDRLKIHHSSLLRQIGPGALTMRHESHTSGSHRERFVLVSRTKWEILEKPAMNTLRKIVMPAFGVLAVLAFQVISRCAGGGWPQLRARQRSPQFRALLHAGHLVPQVARQRRLPSALAAARSDQQTEPQQHGVHRQLHSECLQHRVFSQPVHRGSARRRQGDGCRPGTRLACPGLHAISTSSSFASPTA